MIKSLKRAASAALAITALTGTAAGNVAGPQPEREAFEALSRAYHFQLAQTPELAREFLKDYPSSTRQAEAMLILADWYFFNHEYPSAYGIYTRISDDAFSGDVRDGLIYRKALSMVKTGFYNEAAAYFRSLYGNRQYGEAARFYTAYIDYVNGRYDEAYDQFKKIHAQGPKGAEAEFYLNQIEYLRGNYQKVATTSERLLSPGTRVPDELRAETMRVGGLANFKLGSKAAARNILARYADLTGDGAELSAIYSLATIYYDEGDYDKALPLFSTVTDYPGDLAQSAWLYMGQIYTARGDTQAAALAFDKAARESWDDSVAETASYNLAVTAAAGNALPFSDAALAMENFIESYPSSQYASGLSTYLANAYYGRRDYEAALRQIEKISRPDGETRLMRQKILYQLGVATLQGGDAAKAAEYLGEASASSAPDKEVAAQAALWLGDARYAQKDYKGAIKAYEGAIGSGRLADNTALAYYNLGYAYLKAGNYTKAEAAFKNATTIKGLTPAQTADARLRYGDCLYYTGKYDQAMAVFRNIKLDGGADGVFAQIREADILGRGGKVEEKISILEGLIGNPDAGIWRPTVLSRLADAYSEKGDDRRAAELYAMIIDSNGKGDNSQSYYSLATNAENLYNRGDREAAYNAYRLLEQSGILDLYPSAVMGIMRTSNNDAEIAEYAAKAASLPGLTAEERDEALLAGAMAGLKAGGSRRHDALTTLRTLAASSDRLWGARAAVALGEELLADGETEEAEKVLLDMIDAGSDDNYWLARGYIALADVYTAQDKDYLAKLYLETLRSNYPGSEKDIKEMINSRLKALDK